MLKCVCITLNASTHKLLFNGPVKSILNFYIQKPKCSFLVGLSSLGLPGII